MRRAIGLLPLFVIACSAGSVDDAQSVEQPIVNGVPSTAAQDATVLVAMGQGSCTGTLIAPNLVLTARHCVSNLDENDPCGRAISNMAPSTFGIAVGVRANARAPVARGKRLFVPTNASLCGHDVALIQLDRVVPNAKVAKVRFTPLAVNETTTAVGYGDSGRGQLTPGRYQRAGVKVLAVGPARATFRTRTGQNIPYDVPAGDVATGESTCFGDSGGPLFDAKGEVAAVTSRGIDGSCIDRPSIFASVLAEAALIKDAAKTAGYPLEEAAPPPKPATPPAAEEEDEEAAPPTTKTTDADEEEEEDDAPVAKKKKRTVIPQADGGCSTSGRTPSSFFPILLALLAVVRLSRRRSASGFPVR